MSDLITRNYMLNYNSILRQAIKVVTKLFSLIVYQFREHVFKRRRTAFPYPSSREETSPSNV